MASGKNRGEIDIRFNSSLLVPKALMIMNMAGLLTYPSSVSLPIPQEADSGLCDRSD